MDWFHLFPLAMVRNLQIRASNHAPILLSLNESIMFLPKPFRFIVALCRDSSSFEVVDKAEKLKGPWFAKSSFHLNSIQLA